MKHSCGKRCSRRMSPEKGFYRKVNGEHSHTPGKTSQWYSNAGFIKAAIKTFFSVLYCPLSRRLYCNWPDCVISSSCCLLHHCEGIIYWFTQLSLGKETILHHLIPSQLRQKSFVENDCMCWLKIMNQLPFEVDTHWDGARQARPKVTLQDKQRTIKISKLFTSTAEHNTFFKWLISSPFHQESAGKTASHGNYNQKE